MHAYLLVMLVLLSLSVMGKLMMLSNGGDDIRSPKINATDVFINVIIIVWTVVLLVNNR